MNRPPNRYTASTATAPIRRQGHRDTVTKADTSPSVAFCPHVPCPRAPPTPPLS